MRVAELQKLAGNKIWISSDYHCVMNFLKNNCLKIYINLKCLACGQTRGDGELDVAFRPSFSDPAVTALSWM